MKKEVAQINRTGVGLEGVLQVLIDVETVETCLEQKLSNVTLVT